MKTITRAAGRGITMDYDLAMAIMKDTAERSMRAAGRSKWSRKDYNAGVAAFDACLPVEWETWKCGPVKRGMK